MVDQQASAERRGTSPAQQAPGGGTSRGPEFGTGGEPQVPVPPYDELRGEPGENTAPNAFDASNAPDPGPTPPVSDEERGGVSGTEINPEPALGVGESVDMGLHLAYQVRHRGDREHSRLTQRLLD